MLFKNVYVHVHVRVRLCVQRIESLRQQPTVPILTHTTLIKLYLLYEYVGRSPHPIYDQRMQTVVKVKSRFETYGLEREDMRNANLRKMRQKRKKNEITYFMHDA